ncbi:MAG: hypothetical protein KJN84_03555 [Bacteroidia bacterium]|nr:hypothetical protein [Bacteroidia bacterium]
MSLNIGFGQESDKIDALNAYVQFLNESVHGLFTAHALMVISNKEVNRYIDLDSYILNNISNDEVQSNLFAKSDKENYTTFHTYSPMELKDISKQKSKYLDSALARKLNGHVNKIAGILNEINQIRIDVDNFIQQHDLNDKESIYGVFEILENGVNLFSSYAKAHAQLADDIKKNSPKSQDVIARKANQLHAATQTILRNLRNEDDSNVQSTIDNLKSAFESFNSELISNNYNTSTYKSNIKVKVEKTIALMEGFESPGYVPVEHELYGKHYYYHNEIAKRYYNWSGPGFVRHLNTLLDDLEVDIVQFVEEPLIFKVMYPMKLDDLNTLKEPEKYIKERKPKTIVGNELKLSPIKERPQEDYVTIEIHDFDMFDRDSISITFNGQVIQDRIMISPEPYKFDLTLIEGTENSISFKALNWGIRPPNTFAVSYRYNGERRRQYVEYNLDKEQVLKVYLGK